MKCDECGMPLPVDNDNPQSMIEWVREQASQRLMDEMVYGNSFMCNNCGGRLDPTEIIEIN